MLYQLLVYSETISSTTYRNLCESMLRRQMQARVALVFEVWIAQASVIIAHNSLYEREVVQKYGATQPSRYVNPASD